MPRINSQMIHVTSLKPVYHKNELEIILVLKGSIKLHKMERMIELESGQFSFINRNIVHYIEGDAIVLTFKIHLSSFKHIFERIEYVEFTSNQELRDDKQPIRKKLDTILLDLLIHQYIHFQSGDDSEELYFIEDQLIQTLYSSFQLSSQLKDEEDYINSDLVSRYYYVVEYVFSNIGEKITVEDITKQLFMNSAYFSQFMKKVGGVGFKEFVLYRKLMYITQLLLDETCSLDDIAYKVSISDTKSFYALFKKYYNTSPSKWRRSVGHLKDEYTFIEDQMLLKQFIDEFKIDKHRENTIAKNIKRLSNIEPRMLTGTSLLINPYEDMKEDNQEDYQMYKYLSSLLKIVEDNDMNLRWIFPFKYLNNEYHKNLYLVFLASAQYNIGYSRVKKWRIYFVVHDAEELLEANKLAKETDKMINGIEVEVVLNL